MTIRIKETWHGKGVLFENLSIRQTDNGGLEGLMENPIVSYMKKMTIDLSHHETLDGAILELQKEDGAYYNEIAMYADEG